MKEFYLGFSVIIGLLVTLDGYLLYQARGRLLKNKLIAITSIIEFLWALLSFYVLYAIDFTQWQILVPVLYVVHNLFGWVYSFFMFPIDDNTTTQDLFELQVPRWYTLFCLSFGAVFTSLCLWVNING